MKNYTFTFYELKRSLKIVGKEFYTQNLQNKVMIEDKALDNLLNNYDLDIIFSITNYNEIGIVEFVASGDYFVEEQDDGTYLILREY